MKDAADAGVVGVLKKIEGRGAGCLDCSPLTGQENTSLS